MNSEVVKYNNSQEQTVGADSDGSKFINELTSLPVVKSMSNLANKTFAKLKLSNVIFNYIFSLIDLLVFSLYCVWSKVLNQIGKQVAYVDMFAFNLLIKVEKKFPIITKETGVIVDTLTKKYPHLEKLNQKYDTFKLNALQTLQTKCQLTKNKIEVYKEYLDVLSKHFLVQDGRSLDHVQSLEERTKIIVRRTIGNALRIVQLVGGKFENLLVKTINKTKADLVK